MTPWVAILATTLVAMLLTLVGGLALLAETVVLLLRVGAGSGRRRHRDDPGGSAAEGIGVSEDWRTARRPPDGRCPPP